MKSAIQFVLICPGKDNLLEGPGSKWIAQLETNLGLVIKKYTGRDLITLTAGDKVPKEMFGEPVCLILLMHDSYTSSDTYLSFLNSVSAASQDSNPICIRVETSVQDTEKLPKIFTNAHSIGLTDSEAGDKEWIDEESPNYWSRLLDLAAEVVPAESSQEKVSAGAEGDRVYLAETTPEMGTSRNILKRELSEYGYITLPASDLKYQKSDLKSFIQSQVDKSRLTIHLLGNSYGEPIKDSANSITEVQIQYITEYLEAIENDPVHASKEINRLIWIDPEFNPVDSRQEEFLNQLKRNIENLHRTEIIQTPLELFKTLVINKLRQKEMKSVRDIGDGEPGGKFVYLLHSPDDQVEAGILAGRLAENGLVTGMLDYGKGQIELLKDHKRHLQECDGAVIYYGNPNRPWLNAKVMDLLKAPGLGRKKPLETRQVLAAKKDMLEDYNMPGGLSLTREQDLSKAADQLLKTLK